MLCIVLAALCWATLGPVAKLAFAHGMAPLDVAFWRAMSGWVFFALQAVHMRALRVKSRDLPLLALFGFLGVTVFYGSYQIAVRDGGAALASVLLYTAPAWVVLLARIFLQEALSPVKLVCVALSVAGVAGVAYGSGDVAVGYSWPMMGVVCGLVSGLTYALYYVFSKHLLRSYKASTIFFYIQPLGALFLLPFLSALPADPVAWGAVFFLGLVTNFGAYTLYCLGLERLEASRAAVLATIEPLSAAVLAYFWWDERFRTAGYLGSALIVLSVLVLTYEARRKAMKTN